MKPQIKKGVIEIFILAVLSKGDSYGYKIISDLTNLIDISESTLYPILRRLEQADELKTYNELFQGRNRKYYKLTAKGQQHIELFLKEWNEVKKLYDLLTK